MIAPFIRVRAVVRVSREPRTGRRRLSPDGGVVDGHCCSDSGFPWLPPALAAVLAGPGCIDIVGADLDKYVEREEKTFSTSGKADVSLTTFDGSIEVRPWDKTDVQVIIEKRARDKAAADEIDVQHRTERRSHRSSTSSRARAASIVA